MKGKFFFLFITAIFFKSQLCMIIKHYDNLFNTNNIYNPQPRNLLEEKERRKVIEINKNLDINMRKLKFMKIINNLKEDAKKKHISIKNIKLGKDLKNIFKNPYLVQDMKKFINDKNLKNKIQKVERLLKIEKMKNQQQKIKKKKKNK